MIDIDSTYNCLPNLILHADADKEQFTEIRIITSSSYRKQQAIEQSCDMGGTIEIIEGRARRLLNTLPIVEFVEIFEDYIVVCVDVKRVDDNVVEYVLHLLSMIDKFTPGRRIDLAIPIRPPTNN